MKSNPALDFLLLLLFLMCIQPPTFFSFFSRSAVLSGFSSKSSPIHDVHQVTTVLLFPRQLGSAIRVFLKVFTLQPCVAVHIAHWNPSIHQGSKIYFSLLLHAMDSKLLRPIIYV
uniref:Secreted protein n=1 Tax=Triticum urartu TaxID=4572 RepID=A0A8R7JW76_TRIUA